MEINLGTIIATIINFLFLYFFLKHYFFEKIQKVLNDRENYVNNMVLDVEKDREDALGMLLENKRILGKAEEKGREIIEEEKKKATEIYNGIVSDAKNEAELLLNKAKHDINQEKIKAKFELKKETVDIAINLSEKILEKNVDKESNEKLINDFLSKIG